MAIDYTGITSIDAGAPDIKYTGDEGPRSPEENREIASAILGDEMGEVASQLWNGMSPPEKSEWRSIEGFIQSEDFKIILMQLQSNQQGREGIQMASAADDMLQEEYDKYVFEMEEQGLEPMSFEEFRQEAVAGMATGGRVGYAGGQLVKPSRHGLRPGYRGDAAYRSESEQSKSIGQTGSGKAPSTKSERGDGPTHSQRDIVKDESRRQQRQTTLPSYADEMDVKEQYRLGNEIKVGDVIDPVDRSKVAEGSDWAERKDILKEFEATRPEVTPWWMKRFQGFSDWTTERNRKWFANNVLRAGKLGYGYGDIDEDFDLEAAYQKYMADRMAGKIDAMGNVHPNYYRGPNDTYILKGGDDSWNPMQVATGPVPPPGDPDPDPDPDIPTDSINLANLTQDYTDPSFANPWFYGKETITLADGGRAGYAGGGIADLRQGYFFGKLVKGLTKPFKGITRGVKKLMKSPAGKMAMLAALGFGVPGTGFKGMFGGGQGLAGIKNSLIGGGWMPTAGKMMPGEGAMFSPKANTGFLGKLLLSDPSKAWSMANISPWKAIGGLSAAGGLYTALAGDKDEEPEWLKEWKRKYQAGLTEFAPIGQPETWESIRFADGGRIGYSGGGGYNPGARWSYLIDKFNNNEPMTEDEIKEMEMLEITYADESKGMAQGGRIGYAGGADYYTNLYSKYAQEIIQTGGTPMSIEDFIAIIKEQERTGGAQGGRIGYAKGGNDEEGHRSAALSAMYGMRRRANEGGIMMASAPDPMDALNDMSMNIFKKPLNELTEEEYEMLMEINMDLVDKPMARPRMMAQEGGLMDLGGMEKDYRNEGGFVPIGGQERADDVPARLSKNEFVFTADAVRNAGGGDIDKGAEIMENLMENLEQGGKVSEESQGLEGARNMFATAQRLEGVL